MEMAVAAGSAPPGISGRRARIGPSDMPLAEGHAKTAFFEHFGIPEGDPGLDLLRVVVTHFAGIPYENITKIITKFTESDPRERLRGPGEVVGGYVANNTGGTCFSLTFCLGSILSSCGFECHPAMADMKRPNIHCALVVRLKGFRYLVDPGYLLGEPVPLSRAPARLAAPFGGIELRPRGGDRYDLFTHAGGERKWRYTLKTEPVPQPLFIRFWQDSFSLPMMNSLQLTRLTPAGHLYIRDHHLRFRSGDTKTNENIRPALEARIEREFGIPGTLTAEARDHLERMKHEWRIRKQADR